MFACYYCSQVLLFDKKNVNINSAQDFLQLLFLIYGHTQLQNIKDISCT